MDRTKRITLMQELWAAAEREDLPWTERVCYEMAGNALEVSLEAVTTDEIRERMTRVLKDALSI